MRTLVNPVTFSLWGPIAGDVTDHRRQFWCGLMKQCACIRWFPSFPHLWCPGWRRCLSLVWWVGLGEWPCSSKPPAQGMFFAQKLFSSWASTSDWGKVLILPFHTLPRVPSLGLPYWQFSTPWPLFKICQNFLRACHIFHSPHGSKHLSFPLPHSFFFFFPTWLLICASAHSTLNWTHQV